MSSRRKERKKQEKRKLVRLVLLIVFLLICFTGFVLYKAFIYKQSITSFFPENPLFYARINLSPSFLQAKDFQSVSQKFENPDVFAEFATDFVFGSVADDQVTIDFDEVTTFVGKEVVLGNISITNTESVPVMVVDIKNHEQASDFLAQLKTKLRNRGDAVLEDTFRDEKIVSVLGNREISFSLTDDYLLIAGAESGLKKMIDVSLGSEQNLASNADYKRVERSLKGNKQFVFMYYDLVGLSTTFLDAFELLDDNQLLQLSLLDDLPSGTVLVPDAEGFKVRILAREGKSKAERKSVDERLSSYVPHDIVSYLEGSDLSGFFEGLLIGDATNTDESYRQGQLDTIKKAIQSEYGVDLDEDILSLFKENYGLALMRGVENNKINLALISETRDFADDEVLDKMSNFESIFIDFLKRSGVDDVEGRSFVTNEYSSFSYRRLNLPEKYPFDVNYFVLDRKLIFATTESALQNIIDVQSEQVLADDLVYKEGFSQVGFSNSSELFYLEPQALFKLFGDASSFEYGALDQEIRKLQSLSLKTRDEKDGVFLEGYLKIND